MAAVIDIGAGLSYGGVPSLIPTPELEGWIQANIGMGNVLEFGPMPGSTASRAGPGPTTTVSLTAQSSASASASASANASVFLAGTSPVTNSSSSSSSRSA